MLSGVPLFHRMAGPGETNSGDEVLRSAADRPVDRHDADWSANLEMMNDARDARMAQEVAAAPVASALVGNQLVRTLARTTWACWLQSLHWIDLLPLIRGEPLVEWATAHAFLRRPEAQNQLCLPKDSGIVLRDAREALRTWAINDRSCLILAAALRDPPGP